ncbi:MAG: DUF3572 domain-containing protein [Hyphomicrobiaceae bacterium]|nr:MAG: DUF3572 domain-containing protein [Hyphomicrobiaceae bacterium]
MCFGQDYRCERLAILKSGRRHRPIDREAAETIAAQGLAFLAEDGRRFARFLALTGLDVGDVRAHAGTPALLAAVLEHLAGDESLLLVFAANSQVAPETIAQALAVLQRADGRDRSE